MDINSDNNADTIIDITGESHHCTLSTLMQKYCIVSTGVNTMRNMYIKDDPG